MNPKNAVIAGSIGIVVVGLVVSGVIVYRQRSLQEGSVPAAADVNQPQPTPTAPPTTPTPSAEAPTISNDNPPIGIINASPGLAPSPDSDGDGLADDYEKSIGTDPKKADTDGDGVSDYEEINHYGTNPLDSNSKPATPEPPKGAEGR